MAQTTTSRIPVLDPMRISTTIHLLGCTPIEEDFFRTGEAISAAKVEAERFEELDRDHRPKSIWRILVSWVRGGRTGNDRDPAGGGDRKTRGAGGRRRQSAWASRKAK
jgi:hypothetical protein